MNSVGIYKLYADVEDCATYHFNAYDTIDYWDDYLSRYFLGEPLPKDWKMPNYELGAPDRPLNDFVHGESAAPFISERAEQAIKQITGNAVQFWHLGEIRSQPYYILNVVNVLDCLDLSRSRLLNAADGRVLSLRQAVFDLGKVPSHSVIFKVPQDPRVIYVTDAFVACVRQHRLTGVGFEVPVDVGVSRPKNAFPDLPLKRISTGPASDRENELGQ